ncbi:MAG TPA: hypothetical protein VKL99_11375, partial [Candidatus Angelobacter sp.]|nr:hypothetical protein [Candidatus Angelobacter sp.]
MTRAYLPACNRVFLKIQFAIAVVLLIMLSGLTSHLSALQQAPASGPKIWLQDNQSLPVVHTGAAAQAGLGQPLAMASADIDGDGIADLVVGHSAPGGGVIAIHRGNLDAFAPQSDASLQAIGRGEFPSPFLLEARTLSVPVTPNFIALGNFTGKGDQDLLLAAKGGNALYVFAGDDQGNFAAPQVVNLPGGLT